MLKRKIGDFGELAACEYLKSQETKIIRCNFHTPFGEIDIIADDGEYLIFAEVKTRKSSSYGRPSEFVDYRKQQRIIRTAAFYLEQAGDVAVRFDVIEVFYKENGDGSLAVTEINHIKSAFEC